MSASPTSILLVNCPDQPGIVAKLSGLVFEHGGNIVDSDHHTDFAAQRFLGRIEWMLDGFRLDREATRAAIGSIMEPYGGQWELHHSDQRPRLSIWCSKQDHCLLDLLWRHKAGELDAEIPLIVSNHPELGAIAKDFGLPFHHLATTKATKSAVEAEALRLLEAYRNDFVVLAKYMQIVSDAFLETFPRVINIHHSFLPAFSGAMPYHQAHARGVKVIGATAHYVTPELDAGPIIEQDIIRVSHRDTVEDLVRKGRDLERMALSRAVRLHLQHRVLTYNNRTVVFE